MEIKTPSNGLMKIGDDWVPFNEKDRLILGRSPSGKCEIHKSQEALFNALDDALNSQNLANIIYGLIYQDDFISDEYANSLIQEIDKNKWLPDLTRKVQHYGYKYDYRNRIVENLGGILNFPQFLIELNGMIRKTFNLNFNSAIINEYKSGQGISKHVDAKCFGNEIATISLCEDDELEFERNMIKPIKVLRKNSILILQNDGRYNWTHCIKPKIRKDRRISITFRNVK